MKKTLIIIAMLFACLPSQAQVNHIISTLFEPDSCTYIRPGIDTLKWDLNQDGTGEVFLYSKYHGAGGTMTFLYTAPNWKWSFVDTTIVNTAFINEDLEWESGELFLIIPEEMPPYMAFRHQAEDGVHYGWMYIIQKYYCQDCVSGMGYCTLPDTPIRWGQTELWGMEENGAEGFATLHPNPTTGMVTIKVVGLRQAVVANTLGQQVLSVQGEGDELQIDLSALPAGVYFVTVTDRNGRQCVRKAVRE